MITISADSTCDLSPEFIAKHQIVTTPLSLVVGNRVYKDGVDITPADIFNYVEKENLACHTAAVNVAEYYRHFEKYAAKAEAVIHISLGSRFSSCYQNAVLAAEDFPNVFIIDSQNLSTGSGHLVHDAVELVQAGQKPAAIVQALQSTVSQIETSFVIDTLDYLAKGGRCLGLTARSAALLRLRPCIEVKEGQMAVGRKFRGSFSKVALAYVRDRLAGGAAIDKRGLFITHSGCERSLLESVKKEVQKHVEFESIIETEAGCTISSHCGPNSLGILFKRRTAV